MHREPTLKDRNAVDAPLPDGHPLKREPMRPRGAGSEVRRESGGVAGALAREARIDAAERFGITEENAPRVLRAIYEDEDGVGRGPRNVGKALAIIAVLTAGALVFVVALPYLWAKVVGL